ncbi:2Fe-2S iron-sulfur cluster-binding protein [Streptomyces sp. 7N604]|uniref:2Fe-2S iron-sulfur cluster-binding protein n=1 Tax=Streptomyces sp. 7N604 TaxID=3457415 RepID=UPI003FD6632C
MSSEQQPPQDGQGPQQPRGPHGWEPLPQGEYDAETTAYVRLPEGLLDPSAVPPGADPLAALGHGYVPPPITPGAGQPADPGAPADPRATGQWTMPFADTGAGQGGQGDGGWGDPGAAGAAGQWSVPIAPDDPVGESGEYLVGDRARPAGPYGGGSPAAGGQPWYGGQGAPEGVQSSQDAQGLQGASGQGASDLTGQWTFPSAGEQLPDPAAQSGAAGGPGGPGGQGGQGVPEGWSTTASATGQWAVPTTDAPGTDESGAYPLSEGGAAAAEPWPQGGGEPGAGAAGGFEQPRATRSGAPGRRKLAAGPGGAAAGDRTEPPAADADAGWPPAASGPWQSPDAGAENARRDADGNADGNSATTEAGGSEAGGTQAGASDRSRTRPGGTGDSSYAAPAEGGSLPGRAAEDAINRLTGAGSPAADRAASASRPGSTSGSPDVDEDSGTGTGNGDAPDRPEETAAAHDEAPDEPAEPADSGAADPHSEHPNASYVLSVNGADRPVTDAWIGESLLYVLRERLGLAGAKDGCSQGECGACSVQVDGRLVASCLVPAATTAGSEVRTVEGLAADGVPSDVQRALAASGAVQCGFCVPGLAMTVHDLLEGNHAPTELETRQAICGNLCRCSGYRGVLDAVREVVEGRAESAEAEGEAEAEGSDATDGDTPRIPHQARSAEDSA